MGKEQCEYCVSQSRHPRFVYLLSDKRCINNPRKHRVVPYVGLASNPFLKLRAHNRDGRQYGTGNQLTKSGAGHYQLELVFGPVFAGGREFKRICRKTSRKITHRILRFCDLASEQMKLGIHPTAQLYARNSDSVRRLYHQRKKNTH